MYNLDYLCNKLKQQGLQVHLETSGSHPFSGTFDWVCLSPKRKSPPKPEVFAKANELKCIIFHKSDFAFAEKNRELTTDHCKLYLQTEWSKQEQMLPLMVEYVKQHPAWHISLQTHKYLQIP